MGYTLYKSNKKNTGSAIGFSFRKDKKNGRLGLFVQITRQASDGSYRDNFKYGSGQNVGVKLNEMEMGQILRSIRLCLPYSTVHTSGENKEIMTQISFAPYKPKDSTQTSGFWFNITQNKTDKFSVPIDMGESAVLEQYIIAGLQLNFTESIKSDFEYADKKNGENGGGSRDHEPKSRQSAPTKEPASAPATQNDDNPFSAPPPEDEPLANSEADGPF